MAIADTSMESTEESLHSRHTQKETQDGGCQGWLVVLGSFICGLFAYGIYPAMGPLLVAIQRYFKASSAGTAWILSLIVFLQFGVGPISNVCVKKIGFRMTVMCGAAISSFGFFLSYFAKSILFLYFSLGLCVGFGYGMMLTPGTGIFALFIKKRFAVANYIVALSGGVGVFIFPPMLQILIDDYGWRGTVLVFCAINAHLGIAAALFRSRKTLAEDNKHVEEPVSTERGDGESPTRNLRQLLLICDCDLFTKHPAFVVFAASYFTGVGIGFFGAPSHLVARAEDQQLGSPDEIAFIVSLFGIASTAARLLLTLEACCQINKQEIYNILFGIAFLLAGIANILSAFATSYATYAAYAIVFGLMSGLWFGLFGVVLKASLNAELFVAGVGLSGLCIAVGGLIGPICAGFIYDVTGDYNYSFYFYGSFMILEV
ncbi:monocarboxylate transporter 3-like [Ptychodera flava]|uniref:monocarboxylate transporter 3-like n=1 Tax=Ptychodera flava TaxID=63121 RepID=UPI00396A6AA8